MLLLDTDAGPQKPESMGVIVEWPGEAPAPWRFSFLASETRAPACQQEALAHERGERQREELNALYVAMTRARRHLVLSAHAPLRAHEGSWWRRLEAWATPIESVPEAVRLAGDAALGSFTIGQLPRLPAGAHAGPVAVQEPLASRVGQAMHRLLETMTAGSATFGAAQVRRVAREFALDLAQAQHAARMAQRIAQGEGAWAWDPAAVDWHANEVPLHHGGELLRIDRLVRRAGSGEWWVLDYKSAGQPQQDAGLVAQMQRYRAALQVIHPGSTVHAAFLTAQGRLVRVPQ